MNDNPNEGRQQAPSIIARARKIHAEKVADKAVDLMVDKFDELEKAQTVVRNIEREIEDLQEAIEQGNVPL